jgi:hypothetical protein
MSTPREMQAAVPQALVLSPSIFHIYINDDPQTHGVHLAHFADYTCIVTSAEENTRNLCKALSGKTLFSALYGTYPVALHELKAVL